MKIWLPYIAAGGGADVFTLHFAEGLRRAGHDVVTSAFPRWHLGFPYFLRFVPAPPKTDIVAVHSWFGFAFRRAGIPLVLLEHGLVLDPDYAPYRSHGQALRHRFLLRRFIGAGLRVADAVVAVSEYTARSLETVFGFTDATVIMNGIDTDFFTPGGAAEKTEPDDGVFRLLFVGHLIRRKGVDLLPEIMRRLGPGFALRYTSGWRRNLDMEVLPTMKPIGLVDQARLCDEYRNADALLFPTRFDGFGLPVVEAMACGTPVVASRCCAVPELIEDGVDGIMCPLDDVTAFVEAIQALACDRDRLAAMGARARESSVARFGVDRMVGEYIDVFSRLIEQRL
jgi:glycosyltransferase involved in cell wall biosynthesis